MNMGGGSSSIPSSSSFGSFGEMMGGGGPSNFGSTSSSSSKKRPRTSEYYDSIPTGTVVRLKELVNSPERNGDRGRIVQYDRTTGRYVVQMIDDDDDSIMKIKPSNLFQQHVAVTIHGLQTNTELNGMNGTILGYDDHKQRYTVSSNNGPISLKPSNTILTNGTVGRITGLVSKPELNGQRGTIIHFNQNSDRYDVQLSADTIVRVKLDNIRL